MAREHLMGWHLSLLFWMQVRISLCSRRFSNMREKQQMSLIGHDLTGCCSTVCEWRNSYQGIAYTLQHGLVSELGWRKYESCFIPTIQIKQDLMTLGIVAEFRAQWSITNGPEGPNNMGTLKDFVPDAILHLAISVRPSCLFIINEIIRVLGN